MLHGGGRIHSLHVFCIHSQIVLVYFSDLACVMIDTRSVSGGMLHLSYGQTVVYTSHCGGVLMQILLGKESGWVVLHEF